jgi:hypothetical protein
VRRIVGLKESGHQGTLLGQGAHCSLQHLAGNVDFPTAKMKRLWSLVEQLEEETGREKDSSVLLPLPSIQMKELGGYLFEEAEEGSSISLSHSDLYSRAYLLAQHLLSFVPQEEGQELEEEDPHFVSKLIQRDSLKKRFDLIFRCAPNDTPLVSPCCSDSNSVIRRSRRD